MHRDSVRADDNTEECTTTASFADHDIEDGSALIQRIYYRLSAADTEFVPSEAFFDALESAFIWAYLETVEENGIPDHVEAAIDDTRAVTAEEFADRPDAGLRTEVVQTFYRNAAGFHCAYRT